MVYIKRIEIRGFKSFRGRAIINLCKGLNVITGPNGSGKSNIVDAIKFALGELNPRMLRVERFSELICDSLEADSRKAYVNLVLDNSDRLIPIDDDEIEIQRSIDGSGRMIYKVNGRRSSREAIVDMLSTIGLSPSGANIIMQGTVTRIVDLPPKRRRELLEEIVGISAYDEKKAKAEEELRKAEINFRVAEAKLEAIGEQLEKLAREREQALKYIDLKARVTKLRITLLSARISGLRRELKDLSREYGKIQSDIEALHNRLELLKAERKSIEDELANLPIQPNEADSLSPQLSRLREARIRLEEALKSIDDESLSVKEMQKNLEERLSSVEAEIKSIAERVEALSVEESELIKTIERKRAEYHSLMDRIGGVESNLKSVLEDMVRMHSEYMEAIAIYSQLRSSILEYEAKLSLIEKSMESREDSLRKLDSVETSIKKQVEAVRSAKLKLQEAAVKLLDRLQTLLSSIEALNARSDLALSLVYRCREVASYLRSQLETADKLVNIHSLREAIRRLSSEDPSLGIYGLLSDNVKFNGDLRTALESAAGILLYAVIVKDLDSCLICLDKLRNLNLGKAIVIPLSEIRPVGLTDYPSIDGVIGLSSDFVEYPSELKPIIDLIFGATLIVSNRSLALELSRKGFRSVTVDGEVYEPEGPIRIGSPLNLDYSKFLAKRRLLSILVDLSKRLEKAVEGRSGLKKSLLDECRSIRRSYIEFEKKIAVVDLYEDILEKELARIDGRRRSIQQEILNLRREADQLRAEIDSKRTDARSFEKKLGMIFKQLSDTASKLSSSNLSERLHREVSGIASEISDLEEALLKVRSEKSMLQGRLEMLGGKEYRMVKDELSKLSEALCSLQNRRLSMEEQLKDIDRSIYRIESEIKSRGVGVDSRASHLYERLSAIRIEMESVEESYRQLMDRLRAIESSIYERKAKLEMMEVELRKLGFDQPISVDDQNLSSIEGLIARYEAEIEALGSVNLLSVDEYEDVKRRYDELAGKVSILREEKLSIERFIKEIEDEKKRVFTEFLDKLNSKLREFFSKFTGGGDAWLEPENKIDIFDGGIDLITVFPGKPRRSISIASGGEKTIATLSFIFALSKLNPTSIYILDEVDAHLDPVNLERLALALKELSNECQLIVISLKDVVASKADKIYGVYSRNGLSKVVATALRMEAA
jgi:chromosome segregation protein